MCNHVVLSVKGGLTALGNTWNVILIMNSHRSQLNKLFDWGFSVPEKLKCLVLLKNLTSPEDNGLVYWGYKLN